MYISVPVNQLRLVEAILRDHNVVPSSDHLPVIGGVQLLNIRDDMVGQNLIQRLKEAKAFTAVTSTA